MDGKYHDQYGFYHITIRCLPQLGNGETSGVDDESSAESWQGCSDSENGHGLGLVNSNLEQHACQDGVTRVTVAEAVAGDRAATPITISSELESSSQMSSDLESLPSLGELIGQVKEDRCKQQLEQQLICESPPSKRQRTQLSVHEQVITR